MKKWEQFTRITDLEREKIITKKINAERTIIRDLKSVLWSDIGQSLIEPGKELVSYEALFRCCICLESVIVLIRAGYVGSANALFRQIYELLSWCKIALNVDDDRVLSELHDNYFCNDLRWDGLGKFFQRLEFESDDATLNREIITSEGKRILNIYSCSTHGTSFSQQPPYQREVFYDDMDAVIEETAVWIACLAEVMEDYLRRCAKVEPEEYCNNDNDLLDKRIMHINYLMEMVFKQRCKIERYFSESNKATIFKVFEETRWHLRVPVK